MSVLEQRFADPALGELVLAALPPVASLCDWRKRQPLDTDLARQVLGTYRKDGEESSDGKITAGNMAGQPRGQW
jgi:hypothetical protein